MLGHCLYILDEAEADSLIGMVALAREEPIRTVCHIVHHRSQCRAHIIRDELLRAKLRLVRLERLQTCYDTIILFGRSVIDRSHHINVFLQLVQFLAVEEAYQTVMRGRRGGISAVFSARDADLTTILCGSGNRTACHEVAVVIVFLIVQIFDIKGRTICSVVYHLIAVRRNAGFLYCTTDILVLYAVYRSARMGIVAELHLLLGTKGNDDRLACKSIACSFDGVQVDRHIRVYIERRTGAHTEHSIRDVNIVLGGIVCQRLVQLVTRRGGNDLLIQAAAKDKLAHQLATIIELRCIKRLAVHDACQILRLGRVKDLTVQRSELHIELDPTVLVVVSSEEKFVLKILIEKFILARRHTLHEVLVFPVSDLLWQLQIDELHQIHILYGVLFYHIFIFEHEFERIGGQLQTKTQIHCVRHLVSGQMNGIRIVRVREFEHIGSQYLLTQLLDAPLVVRKHILQNAGSRLPASLFAFHLNHAGNDAVGQQIADSILCHDSVLGHHSTYLRNVKLVNNMVLHELRYRIIVLIRLRAAHRMDRVQIVAAQTLIHSKFIDREIAVIQHLCRHLLDVLLQEGSSMLISYVYPVSLVMVVAHRFLCELNKVLFLGGGVEFPQFAVGRALHHGVLQHDLLCGNHAAHHTIERLGIRPHQIRQFFFAVVGDRLQSADNIFGNTRFLGVFSGIDFIELLLQPFIRMLRLFVLLPIPVHPCNGHHTILRAQILDIARIAYLPGQIDLFQLGIRKGYQRIRHVGAAQIPSFISGRVIFSPMFFGVFLSVLDIIERGLLGCDVCVGFFDQLCEASLQPEVPLKRIIRNFTNQVVQALERLAHLTKCVFAVVSRWVGLRHLCAQRCYLFAQLVGELSSRRNFHNGSVRLLLEHAIIIMSYSYERSLAQFVEPLCGLRQTEAIVFHIIGLFAGLIRKTVVLQWDLY